MILPQQHCTAEFSSRSFPQSEVWIDSCQLCDRGSLLWMRGRARVSLRVKRWSLWYWKKPSLMLYVTLTLKMVIEWLNFCATKGCWSEGAGMKKKIAKNEERNLTLAIPSIQLDSNTQLIVCLYEHVTKKKLVRKKEPWLWTSIMECIFSMINPKKAYCLAACGQSSVRMFWWILSVWLIWLSTCSSNTDQKWAWVSRYKGMVQRNESRSHTVFQSCARFLKKISSLVLNKTINILSHFSLCCSYHTVQLNCLDGVDMLIGIRNSYLWTKKEQSSKVYLLLVAVPEVFVWSGSALLNS